MKPWIKNKVLVSIVTTMILAISYSFLQQDYSGKVAAQTTPHRLLIPGRVESVSREVQLMFEQTGKIQKIYVKEGDLVEKDQVIAEQHHEDLLAQLKGDHWQLEQAKARAARYRSQKEYEAARLQRREKMQARQALTQEDLESIKYEYHQAQQHLVEAQAEIQAVQAILDKDQVLLDKTQLRSSIQGKVIRLYAQEGEAVLTSVDPSPVAIVADVAHLQVRAEVDEAEFNQVKIGQKAWVSADAFPDIKIPAQVIQIMDAMGKKKVTTENPLDKIDTDVLEVLLKVTQNPLLKLGLRVEVTIEM